MAPDTAVEPVELVNTESSEMIPAMVQWVLKVLPTALKAGSEYSFGTWQKQVNAACTAKQAWTVAINLCKVLSH